MPQTPSLYREEDALFLHKAESGPLLYVEEADSFFVQGRVCVLYTSERVSLSAICREGRLLLCTEERESSLHRG